MVTSLIYNDCTIRCHIKEMTKEGTHISSATFEALRPRFYSEAASGHTGNQRPPDLEKKGKRCFFPLCVIAN